MTLGLTPEQQDLSDAVGKFAGRHAPVAATRDSFGALAAGQLPGWWDALVALRRLAAERGPDCDDAQRALGELDAYANAIKALGVRETIRLLDGQASGPASSIAKVAMNVLLRRTFKATLELTGRAAMVADTDPAIVQPYLHLPAELLGGGTREIQLNIIAQMILGLPRK